MPVKNQGNEKKCRRTIVCPNCSRSISFPSSKKCTVFIKCRPCREAERRDFIEIIREIVSSEKDSKQTIKDAMREYLKNPDSIHITAARKKRYRNSKWKEQLIREKGELGISGDQWNLSDIKTISNLILRIYGLEEDEIMCLTRTWKKIIRILASEIIARRTFVPLEKRRSNLKRPYLVALHRQAEYKKITFMLFG